MRSPFSVPRPLVFITAAVLLSVACSSSSSNGPSCGNGTPPSLSGSYSLLSYKAAGTVIPGATGSLTLYPATGGTGPYAADLDLLNHTISDSGTYTVTGASCIRQESSEGNGTTSGTFSLEADTLTVTGTNSQAGGAVVVRWIPVIT
jgi:hypothetical protein